MFKGKLFKQEMGNKSMNKRIVNPKLNSQEYRNATLSIKNTKKYLRRLEILLIRITTRIEKINSFLREDDLEDKELKSKISLLAQLLGVKKQIKLEIKSLGVEPTNSNSSLGDILK